MELSNAPGVAGLSSGRRPPRKNRACPRPVPDFTMRKRLSSRFLVLGLILMAGNGFCRAQELGHATEKAPSVIPPPRAEPVVPPSPAKSIATQLNDAYVSVFERVAPAVVVIDVTKKAEPRRQRQRRVPGLFPPGAGRRFRRARPASPSRAVERGGPGSSSSPAASSSPTTTSSRAQRRSRSTSRTAREFPARLIGTDEKTDIAVVKIDATDLPVEELADSDAVRVGEIACAIGVPYNEAFSFTAGVVSAKGRRLNVTPDGYEDYIQTDASINPGNSGGPLVDLDGKVIGMNTLINGLNRGLGFAIPSNMIREVGDQLIHAGHVVRPYIGVRIETLEEAVAKIWADLRRGEEGSRDQHDPGGFARVQKQRTAHGGCDHGGGRCAGRFRPRFAEADSRQAHRRDRAADDCAPGKKAQGAADDE